MSTIEVKVPDIGDFTDVPVIEVLVKPGDTVAAEDSLVTLESDKATMDVPSPAAGTVKEVRIKVGDKVAQGTLVLLLDAAEGGAAKPAATAAPAPKSAAPRACACRGGCRRPPSRRVRAPCACRRSRRRRSTPPASRARTRRRRCASSRASSASTSPGSPAPVRRAASCRTTCRRSSRRRCPARPRPRRAARSPAAARSTCCPWPQVDFAKFGPVESKPLSRIKKLSGANLARNWVMIPHVTQFDEADITDLEALRVPLNKENEKAGIKLTMLAFLIKASVAALKKFPDFNASLDGDNLVYKQYFHIGFAADTPNGLVVPVLKNADQKGVLQISKEMGELSAKAREGKLGPADMQGGCFSISSLGGIGGTAFTPIINAPEVAILGVSKSATRPVWDGKAFAPRLMVPLSLSYDHRVIDGASAARFTAYLATLLADLRRAVL